MHGYLSVGTLREGITDSYNKVHEWPLAAGATPSPSLSASSFSPLLLPPPLLDVVSQPSSATLVTSASWKPDGLSMNTCDVTGETGQADETRGSASWPHIKQDGAVEGCTA